MKLIAFIILAAIVLQAEVAPFEGGYSEEPAGLPGGALCDTDTSCDAIEQFLKEKL